MTSSNEIVVGLLNSSIHNAIQTTYYFRIRWLGISLSVILVVPRKLLGGDQPEANDYIVY